MNRTPAAAAALLSAVTFLLVATAPGAEDSTRVGGSFSTSNPSPFQAAPHPGDLDPHFGSGGRVLTDFGSNYDAANAVALQRDGKIVVAGESNVGDLALARYQTDGKLDPSFGSGGMVRAPGFRATGVAIQPDGKIVLVGGHDQRGQLRLGLTRYDVDGNLDPSFGSRGLVLTHFRRQSPLDSGTALGLQPDGKIGATGWTGAVGPHTRVYFALARYLPRGQLDQTFGRAGKVVTSSPLRSSDAFASALAIRRDARIVVAGANEPNVVGGPSSVMLARYRANGSLDRGFGRHGRLISRLPGIEESEATGVAIDRHGKIVVVGWGGNQIDFILARFRSSGRLDSRFGKHGAVTTDFGGEDFGSAIAIQRDGKLIVAGGTDRGFALARYTPAGRLDRTFGVNGKTVTRFTGKRDEVTIGEAAIAASCLAALSSDEEAPRTLPALSERATRRR